MASKEFWQIDVFTTERFKGNPCAVVLDGAGLSEAPRPSGSPSSPRFSRR